MSREICSKILKPLATQQKCCCFVPLRIGCIILASVGIIFGCCSFAATRDWPAIVYAVVCLLSGVSLLYGAIQHNEYGVFIYFIACGIQTTVATIIAIFWFVYLSQIEVYKDQLDVCMDYKANCQTLVVVMAIFSLFVAGINAYSFTVAVSFYVNDGSHFR